VDFAAAHTIRLLLTLGATAAHTNLTASYAVVLLLLLLLTLLAVALAAVETVVLPACSNTE
jgi:heme/copper-type cytochrome/quinol oxidase subunit 4